MKYAVNSGFSKWDTENQRVCDAQSWNGLLTKNIMFIIASLLFDQWNGFNPDPSGTKSCHFTVNIMRILKFQDRKH